MKRIYYSCVLALCLGITSCKEFLETEPSDFLAPNTYFQTEAQINFVRAGVYHNLGAGGLWGSWANYLLGFNADEGYMNRANLPIGPWYSNHTPSDGYILGFWNNLYNGINRANVLLANLDNNSGLKQEFRDRVRGEALFLRAYYYFMLVQSYGGVPLKLTPTTSVVEVNQGRATAREVYDQIIKDMEQAETLVPGIKEVGFGGQISKSAVRGLLARVNLYMAGQPINDATRYAEARKWAKMIMDDTEAGHDLNPSYPQVFMNYSADLYDIKESIWEVEFQGNRLDQYVETTNIGWINGPPSAITSATGRADAYMLVCAPMLDVYTAGDQRKYWNNAYFTYKANTQIMGDKTLLNDPTPAQKYAGRYSGKFRREYETLLPKSATQTPINMPLLRFADVLLMFAEAENALNGPTPEAIEAVNRVRRRGWGIGGIKSITVTNKGTGYTSVPTVTFSGGGGSGAAATAVRGTSGSTLNTITSIGLARDPSGVTLYQIGKYTSPPTITITGGGGTGATATATLYTEADANLTTAQTNSAETFLSVIQDERVRELGFEGLRKGDLIRWGIYVETMQNVGNSFKAASTDARVKAYDNVEPKHLLFPIPSNEINTNLAITQNPGW